MHFSYGPFWSAGRRRRNARPRCADRAADAVTIEDRFVEVNGTRLNYLVAGARHAR